MPMILVSSPPLGPTHRSPHFLASTKGLSIKHSITSNKTNSGLYYWSVPNAALMQIRIIGHDAAENVGVGFSSNLSTSDTTTPIVTITSPSASASLTAGSPAVIQLTATDNVGVVQIDLEFSLDNGNAWHEMASGIGNVGS